MGTRQRRTFKSVTKNFLQKFSLLVQYNRRQVSALEHSIGVGTMISWLLRFYLHFFTERLAFSFRWTTLVMDPSYLNDIADGWVGSFLLA